MSNTFFVFLPSNTPNNEANLTTPNYPNNRPNKFRVRLPKPLRFNGNWVCGLHSISFAYSWPSTIGTLDEQFINIHFKHKDKQRIIQIPVPKASHTTVDDLRDFLARILETQAKALKSINSGEYVNNPALLKLPPGNRLKRASSIPSSLPPPPPPKTPKKDEVKTSSKNRPISPPKIETVAKGRTERTSDQKEMQIPVPSITIEPFDNKKPPSPPKTALNQSNDESKTKSQTIVQNLPLPPPPPTSNVTTPTKTTTENKKDENNTISKSSLSSQNTEMHSKAAEKYLSNLLGANRYDLDFLDLELFQKIIGGIELQYHKGFERFLAVFKDERIDHISFTQQLGYVLGFANYHKVNNGEIAKYGCDLRGGFSSFGVYAKGLTENMIIGNALGSLLRVVSVTGATPGEYHEKIYDSPIYCRVLPREINEIQISLRTLDDGRPVPFAFGTVLAVLIFKRVIDF